MKIVALSDTHMRHADIVDLPEGDMIIHAGDFCSYGKRRETESFLEWFASFDFKYKIFIAGNHDLLFEQSPSEARNLVPEGITYLQDESIVIEGNKIYGSPYTLKHLQWGFMKSPGVEIQECWAKIPNDVDLLITHSPPFEK